MRIPSRALVVGAHPDDCEFGAGGTVWAWVQAGCEVHFLVVTDGSQGSADKAYSRGDLVEERRQEQQNGARVLGVEHCHFLGRPDGQAQNDLSLVKAIVEVIRTIKPEVVLTHTPEALDHRPFNKAAGAWVNHRDHRAVSQATLDAVYPYSRNPNSFPELNLPSHKVRQLLLWGSRFPNLEVAIEAGLDKKAKALAEHKSQFDKSHDWEQLKSLWGPLEKFETVELST